MFRYLPYVIDIPQHVQASSWWRTPSGMTPTWCTSPTAPVMHTWGTPTTRWEQQTCTTWIYLAFDREIFHSSFVVQYAICIKWTWYVYSMVWYSWPPQNSLNVYFVIPKLTWNECCQVEGYGTVFFRGRRIVRAAVKDLIQVKTAELGVAILF